MNWAERLIYKVSSNIQLVTYKSLLAWSSPPIFTGVFVLKFCCWFFSSVCEGHLVSNVGTSGSAGSSSLLQSEDQSVKQEHSTGVSLNTLMNGRKAGKTTTGSSTQHSWSKQEL